MLFREVIELIPITLSQNGKGQITKTEGAKKIVFANKKSVKQSEFYQAKLSKLNPEIVFIIRSIDYAEEKRVEFNNSKYDIIRTYDKNGEFIELICEKVLISA